MPGLRRPGRTPSPTSIAASHARWSLWKERSPSTLSIDAPKPSTTSLISVRMYRTCSETSPGATMLWSDAQATWPATVIEPPALLLHAARERQHVLPPVAVGRERLARAGSEVCDRAERAELADLLEAGRADVARRGHAVPRRLAEHLGHVDVGEGRLGSAQVLVERGEVEDVVDAASGHPDDLENRAVGAARLLAVVAGVEDVAVGVHGALRRHEEEVALLAAARGGPRAPPAQRLGREALFLALPQVGDHLHAHEHAGDVRAEEGADRPRRIVPVEVRARDVEDGADLAGVLRECDHVDHVVERPTRSLEEAADGVEDVPRLCDEVAGGDQAHLRVEGYLARDDEQIADARRG